jgi:hypothetical protein
MEIYNVFWSGKKGVERVLITRPKGTTGNIVKDFRSSSFRIDIAHDKIMNLECLGTLSSFSLLQTRRYIETLLRRGYSYYDFSFIIDEELKKELQRFEIVERLRNGL